MRDQGHLEGATGTIEVAKHPLPLLHIYEVTEQDLSALNRSHFMRAVHTTLMGISFSTAVSFLVVLLTVEVSNSKVYAIYVAIVIINVFLFIYSLTIWLRGEYENSRQQKRLLNQAKPAGIANS
ncbi:MAG: hypothetical protein WDM80_06065 [Limisphaerales bacterium]